MADSLPAAPLRRLDRVALACLGGCGLLLVVALGRAVTLPDDWFDAYQCRLAGRALVGAAPWAEVPVYRSPLFMGVCGLGEALGPRAGWLAPGLFSVGGYVALLAGSGLLAARLGAPTWAAALVALLVGLDRLAFLYAPCGLPDVTAAGLCALALACAARPAGEGPWPARPLRLGLLIGLAALARHNAALVGLGLLAAAFPIPRPVGGALRPRPSLARLALAGALGLGLYLLLTTALFAWARGSLRGGLAAHGELLAFQAAQGAENRVRYGPMAGWTFPLRAALVASPALVPLACLGVSRALREAGPAARACLTWVAVHMLFLELLIGHGEARYGLQALPGLAGLGALALAGLEAPRRPWLPAALALLLPALALGLGAPYELRRLSDPVHRGSFAARVAEVARGWAGPEGRYLYTTSHPYGVAPRVLFDPGTPYPGDPVHGILHLGPPVLEYHLRRPVAMLLERGAGLRDPREVGGFVRDTAGFRPGDVLLVGEPRPCLTWTLASAPPGPFGVARVVDGPDGLDLEWRWLTPGAEEEAR